MPVLFWYASAHVKRYTPEIGSESVDALFEPTHGVVMMVTAIGCAETYSILVRRLNGASLTESDFGGAASLLRSEVVESSRFKFFPISDGHFLSSLHLVRKHNLNATDATLLLALLEVSRLPGACVMVTSDTRLERATVAEGLAAFNPQNAVAADGTSLLIDLAENR